MITFFCIQEFTAVIPVLSSCWNRFQAICISPFFIFIISTIHLFKIYLISLLSTIYYRWNVWTHIIIKHRFISCPFLDFFPRLIASPLCINTLVREIFFLKTFIVRCHLLPLLTGICMFVLALGLGFKALRLITCECCDVD